MPSVPVSKLPDLVYATKLDLAELGLPCTMVGHVGDGNFHALLLFKNDEELALAKEAVHRMVHRAIALDGTCERLFSRLPSLYRDLLRRPFRYRRARRWCW